MFLDTSKTNEKVKVIIDITFPHLSCGMINFNTKDQFNKPVHEDNNRVIANTLIK